MLVGVHRADLMVPCVVKEILLANDYRLNSVWGRIKASQRRYIVAEKADSSVYIN